MKALKEAGGTALGCVLMIAFLALPFAFLFGAAKLARVLTPYLPAVGSVAFILTFFVLFPLAAIKPMRAIAGAGLYFVSYAFGLVAWFSGLLVSFDLWGWIAVVVGLFLFGVGVTLIALVALAVNGLWAPFFALLVITGLTFITRMVGAYLAVEASDVRNDAIDIP